jgi:hypothetical protein
MDAATAGQDTVSSTRSAIKGPPRLNDAVTRSCPAQSASGSVPGSTLATAVSRGRRFRPPDRRKGRRHEQPFRQPAPLAFPGQPHQPARLQRVQVVVDLLPSQADPRGQRRRRRGNGQLGEESTPHRLQGHRRRRRIVDDLDAEHEVMVALTTIVVKHGPRLFLPHPRQGGTRQLSVRPLGPWRVAPRLGQSVRRFDGVSAGAGACPTGTGEAVSGGTNQATDQLGHFFEKIPPAPSIATWPV